MLLHEKPGKLPLHSLVFGSMTASVFMLRNETSRSPAANIGNLAAHAAGSGSTSLRWVGSLCGHLVTGP